MGVFKQRTPQKIYFSLSVTHCEDRYLVVAFPVVLPVLSANLSEERIFNGVFEQRLFINQPVEVRVGPRVLGSSKVNSPGGFVSF